MTINLFRGKYYFLSNFYPCKIIMDHIEFDSVEHTFQASKQLDFQYKINIFHAETPGQAKILGRKAVLRSDWESIKLDIMYQLVRQKFLHPELKEKLLSTGNELLVEGNYWGDTFWGVCNGVGQNNLGRILMRVRSELKVE